MFCTKCGNQAPDGSVMCPHCGAPLAGAAPVFTKKNIQEKIFETSKSINWLGLGMWLLTVMFSFFPAIMPKKDYAKMCKAYNLFSLNTSSVVDFSIMLFLLPMMIIILISFLMKKDVLATVVAGFHAVFSMIVLIVMAAKVKDSTGDTYNLGWGFIVYLILSFILIGAGFVWPFIQKSMATSAQQKALMAQQQQQMFMQQQQMFMQQQQMMAQQQQQPQQQQPPVQ